MGGDVKTLNVMRQQGASITDVGFITLSKKKKNMVLSNAIGCAAYHGKTKMLKEVVQKLGKQYVDVEAIEEPDTFGKKVHSITQTTSFAKEMSKYTPLMLAVSKGDENLDCLKYLLEAGADYTRKDTFDNTVLHIAALNGNNAMLEYMAKNLKIDLFARNKNGETALNVCQGFKNTEGIATLEQYQIEYDSSKDIADSLLNEVQKEEQREKEAAGKRKEKKWRNKINRLAKSMNISPEEVEA